MQSFRVQDMRAEQKLAEFMDEYFYSKLKAKNNGPLKYTRIMDKNVQLNGVDICIEADNKKMLIDEKAALYYSNAMIPTFVFELDSLQKGHSNPVEGWFINDELMTEYYMLIWTNIKCVQTKEKQWIRKDINSLEKDDFTIVEAMLIKKKDIQVLLENEGYDKNHLVAYAKKMRDQYAGAKEKKEEQLMDNVKVTFSGQLAEKPVNLVIRKELLKKLAKGIYLISQDGFAVIKG